MRAHYPFVVIGAGAGGLVVAIGLARAGKQVLLIENGRYGGDCTHFGCVPSKTLIARSKEHDPNALLRVREVVASIARHEDPEALRELGVETLTGRARFHDAHTLEVADRHISADRIVIATGSRPSIPPIAGLEEVSYLTNETIFSLEKIPEHLVVMGGGPIGCELAQSFRRLGAKVSIIEKHGGFLHRDDQDASQALVKQFREEGIDCYFHHDTLRVAKGVEITLRSQEDGEEKSIRASHLLVGTGREPVSDGMGLEEIGVKRTKRGHITLDSYGRSSLPHVFAVGDVTTRPPFTHSAENVGRTVLTNLLLPRPFWQKLGAQAVPHVTFTSPEIGQVGLTEREAVETYGEGKLAIYKVEMAEVDRAITDDHLAGFVKLITKKWSGRLLGATVVCTRAGEMISELALAIRERIPVRRLASLIHPYPTYSLAIRKAADGWLQKTILPLVQRWVKKS